MSTRSMIGRENPDGSVTAIYCHFDGYPSGVGKILAAHYTDPTKVDALLALGDISSLGAEIGERHDFDVRPNGVCTAYHRDRGEDIGRVSARTYDAAKYVPGLNGTAYAYLLRDGAWHLVTSGTARAITPLAQALARENEDDEDEATA